MSLTASPASRSGRSRRRKVEKGTAPGEWYSPTQPIPTKPKPYTRTGVTTDELIDFTPAMHAEALEAIKKYKIGPIYTPPVVSNANGPIATIMVGAANGGTNWPGGSFNPENHTVYVYGCNDCMSLTALVPPPPGMTDLPYVEGLAGQRIVMVNAAGADAGADAAPAVKRPARPAGRRRWRFPHRHRSGPAFAEAALRDHQRDQHG